MTSTADMAATCTPALFQGQPCLRLALPGGDSATVALHGATVLSWIADGRERLFLSHTSRFNGRDAIRGGVPVCWPQFNARGDLPKHGFARNRAWQVDGSARLDREVAEVSLSLSSNEDTQALWPHRFATRLTLTLWRGALRIALGVHNPGDTPLAFTGALHTYLRVHDTAQVTLTGLGGLPQWDALLDVKGQADDLLRFPGSFDRVYSAAAGSLRLQDGDHALAIAQSPEWAHTVVWNPGADGAALLTDLEPGGHRHMLCVEAAQVFQPVTVAAGGRWQGWQQFNVV